MDMHKKHTLILRHVCIHVYTLWKCIHYRCIFDISQSKLQNPSPKTKKHFKSFFLLVPKITRAMEHMFMKPSGDVINLNILAAHTGREQ